MLCGKRSKSDAAFKDHYPFYQEVLSNESITSNRKLTAVTLQLLNHFIFTFPRDLFDSTLCIKSFIEPLLSLLQTCTDPMVMYSVMALLHLFFTYYVTVRMDPRLCMSVTHM